MDEVINTYNKQVVVLGHIIDVVLASSETQNKILSSVEVLHRKTDGCATGFLSSGSEVQADH
jgi:hypothetical protein